MNIIVVYPGRFHPFHLGHKASYDYLTNKFGDTAVYIATSNVQDPETSPFDYTDKVTMMTKLGIPASHVVQTKNPYRADEIIGNLSDEERATTALVFAVSEKDNARFSFKPKKDGSPSYLQPLPDNLKKLKPMTDVGYVFVTPTVNFRVRGADANSATAIRKMYVAGSPADRAEIITDLYGDPDPELQAIFDKKLGANPEEKTITYGKEIIDGGTVDGGMRESRRIKLKQLEEKIHAIKQRLKEAQNINPDYIDEKISR